MNNYLFNYLFSRNKANIIFLTEQKVISENVQASRIVRNDYSLRGNFLSHIKKLVKLINGRILQPLRRVLGQLDWGQHEQSFTHRQQVDHRTFIIH